MTKPPSNRRTTQAGYARGDDTRGRVIASGLKLFGKHGFDGASTRDIAIDAGVNTPAVHYYFSGKEGLYLACVEHMAAEVCSHIEGAATEADALLVKHAAAARLIEAYCHIQERMVDLLLGAKACTEWVLILARAQGGLGPDAGFDVLYRKVSARLLGVQCALLARLLCIPEEADETRILAMTLHGQITTFMFMRRTALSQLGSDAFRATHVELVKRTIADNTRSLLAGMIAQRRPGRRKKTVR